MLHQVEVFFDLEILNPLEFWVQAMEKGTVHVDAVNSFGCTFGVVSACERSLVWKGEVLARYWALKPNVQKFWTGMTWNPFCVILSRIADISALWEDLSFIYNLAAGDGNRLAWVLPELDRRVSASLRFAWIAAVVL